MTDQELKLEILTKHGIREDLYIHVGKDHQDDIFRISENIINAMEEWAGIISKRTEDNLLEEMGFTDDPDRFNSSLDDVIRLS